MNEPALQAAIAFLDSWLTYRARETDLPGFSVAIGYRDRIVFDRAYGLARTEPAEPLTPQHWFAAASQSKMLTATAALHLVQAGRLHLDDPAAHYATWLRKHPDPRWSRLTIRQLLSHSAGLPRDGDHADYWQSTQLFPDVSELRQTLLATQLAVEPNAQLKYSNLGYALLGQAIEAASGQSYADYVTQHVLCPLGLDATIAVEYNPDQSLPLVTGYSPRHHRQRVPLNHQPLRTLAPAIGTYATAADLCRFVSSHYFGNESILSDELKREAQRDQWLVRRGYNQGMAFGLGFEIQHVGSRRLVGHSGHLTGHTTATFFDPHDQLAISVMTNCRHHDVYTMVNGLFGTLDYFNQYATESTPASLRRFAGRFTNQLASIEIVAAGRHLAAIDPDDWLPFASAQALERLDATTLRITSPGSVFDDGELCRYFFNAKTGTRIRYAGFTIPSDRA